MISGTFVLTDTLKAGFGQIFTTRLQVDRRRHHRQERDRQRSERQRTSHRRSTRRCSPKVQALPGVAQADGGISDNAQLVGRDGKVISERLRAGTRVQRASGRRPALQPADARRRHLAARPGPDRDRREHREQEALRGRRHDRRRSRVAPVQQYKIAGIVKLGDVSSIGGATMAIFDLPTAQKLFDKVGKYDTINVAAKQGVSPAQLVAQIRPILPPTTQVRTGQGRGGEADVGHERLHQHHPEVPARVRRHRALRRHLRDREHAVDHDRAARA